MGLGDSGWVACWAKTPNEPDKSCGWWSQSQMFLLEVRDWPSALTASPAWDDVLWCLRENICMLEVSAMHSQETPHSPCHSALCWNPEIDPLLKKHFRFLGLGVMSDSQQMLTEHLFLCLTVLPFFSSFQFHLRGPFLREATFDYPVKYCIILFLSSEHLSIPDIIQFIHIFTSCTLEVPEG